MPELSYGYVYKFTPVVEMRLKQAGVRLAAYLERPLRRAATAARRAAR